MLELGSLEEFLDLIKEVLYLPVGMLIDTHKRVHWIYLLFSLGLCYLVFLGTKQKSGFLRYVFSKKVWWGNSAKVDYYFIFLNSAVKVLLLGPVLIWGLELAFWTRDNCFRFIGEGEYFESSLGLFVAYTLVITVAKDFLTFLIHYLMHTVPFLWEFHKTHHSATTLSPFTQYRIHPVELVLNNLFALVGFGLITGVFDWLSKDGIQLATVLGSNFLLVIWRFLGANLRHSHVRLRFPSWLEKWFISPYQHQIHHSDDPRFFNKNMGSMLAIWDYFFGTLARSKELAKVRFGLGKQEYHLHKDFWSLALKPFVWAFRKRR